MSEDIKKLDDLDNVRVLLARHKQACEAVVPENEPAGEDAAVEQPTEHLAELRYRLVVAVLWVILAMIIWGLLTSAFIARLIRFPHSVLAEVRHPVLSSFVSLFPATTMLVAIGFVPWFRPLAVCLFSFGVVVQLAYAAWQTAGLWRGSHPEEATTPGLYLPTVANNFISAMACGALGYTDAGLVFLGAGVFSWLSLEPVILQRLRKIGRAHV